MAGIDKTYVRSWEDYVKIRDWVKSVGEVKDDFGNIFSPLDWMIWYEEIEFKEAIENQRKRYISYYSDSRHIQEAKECRGEDWEPKPESVGELMLWNTPTFFDIWLIRECPISFIQDRLYQQYGTSYTELKERKSVYDLYVRPAASFHFKLSPRVFSKRKCWWEIKATDFYYNRDQGKWYHWLECREFTDDSFSFRGYLGKRKLARELKKWGFPAGTKIEIINMEEGTYVWLVIKK